MLLFFIGIKSLLEKWIFYCYADMYFIIPYIISMNPKIIAPNIITAIGEELADVTPVIIIPKKNQKIPEPICFFAFCFWTILTVPPIIFFCSFNALSWASLSIFSEQYGCLDMAMDYCPRCNQELTYSFENQIECWYCDNCMIYFDRDSRKITP